MNDESLEAKLESLANRDGYVRIEPGTTGWVLNCTGGEDDGRWWWGDTIEGAADAAIASLSQGHVKHDDFWCECGARLSDSGHLRLTGLRP